MNLNDSKNLYNKNKRIMKFITIFTTILLISLPTLISNIVTYILKDYKSITSSSMLTYITFFIVSIPLSIWLLHIMKMDLKKLEYMFLTIIFVIFMSAFFMYIYMCGVDIMSIIFIVCSLSIIVCTYFKKGTFNKLEEWQSAIHEASHCIVCEIYFPGCIDKVVAERLHEEGVLYGGMTYASIDDIYEWEHYVKLIDIYLAGRLGENIFIEKKTKMDMLDDSVDSKLIIEAYEKAINYNLYFAENSYDSLDNLLIARYSIVEDLLYQYKDAIIALSIKLHDNKNINGDEIRIFIKNTIVNNLA